MKKIRLLLLIACALSVWQMKGQVAIALPPSSSVIPTGNQTLMNQTINGNEVWYNWINDSSSVSINISMTAQGLQNNLSSAELYAVSSGSLVILDRDTLIGNGILLFAKNVTANSSLYLRILNVVTGCTSCMPANPIVNLSILNVTPGCTGYVQPPCEYVKDGSFEFFNIPCPLIKILQPSGNYYNNFAPCYWNLPAFTTGQFADLGSTDYFNDCAPTTPIGSSSNSTNNVFTSGYTSISANTGNGYVGFYAHGGIGPTGSLSNYREYVTEALALPLVSTNTYVIKLNLRLAYVSGQATPNIKCMLSNAVPVQLNAGVLPITGQLLNFGAPAVTNKLGWTQLTYTFVANSGYNQITIGNFENDANTTIINVGGIGVYGLTSYYFLDDVSIKPVSTFSVASQNISECLNSPQTVTLSVSPPTTGVTYSWSSTPATASLSTQTGSAVVVSPTVTTTYTITNGLPGCLNTTNAQVTVNPAFNTPLFVASTPTMCAGSVFNINPAVTTSGIVSFTLYPTATVAPNAINQNGIYTGVNTYTTGTNTYTIAFEDINGCVLNQTLSVYVNTLTPSYTIAPTTLCAGQTVTLTTDANMSFPSFPLSIDWGDGAGATNYYAQPQTYVYATAGTYTVIATGFAGGCQSTYTQVIHVTTPTTPTITVIPAFNAPLCIGACRTYTANGAVTYTWSTGVNTPTATFCPTVQTTYSVQGTSACGIVGTKTFVVSVYPLQAPITALANPNPICLGASTSLQASGANSYTWTGAGLGTGGAQGNNVPITPTVTTTYTVFGNNGICANSTQSAVVTVTVNGGSLPVFAITSPNFNVCANGTGTNTVLFGTSLTSTTGLTFTWSPTAVNTPTANIGISQPIVVTVTVANSCSVTQTQSVCINYVASTCCTFTSALSSFTVNSTTINNQTFRIAANQTITLNGTVSYNNCDFLMGTNSAIIALPTVILNLSNCKLYSCEGMWQGIVLQHNSNQSAKIYVRNTTIEDAFNGINSDYPLNVFIQPSLINVSTTSVFNKNYEDIVITYNTTYANNSTHPLTFANSKMISNATTTSPGTNLKCSGYYTPTIRDHSYAGLYAENAGMITFTNNVGGNNLVKNKDYGLVFRKTSADVWNVDFKDMIGVPLTFPNAFPLGVAIVSQNAPKYLNVKPIGTSTVTSVTFSNIGYGIIANKTPTVDVQRCSFNNPLQGTNNYGTYGIYTVDANSLLRMNYNTINKTYYGCSASFSVIPTPATYSMSISNNTITAGTGSNFQSITVAATTTYPMMLGAMVVAANQITKAQTGIFTTNVHNGLRISGNTITLITASQRPKIGIYLAGNNNGLMVDNNNINGNQTGTAGNYNLNCYGIRSDLSPNCFIQCNSITKVGNGITYNGNNLIGSGTGTEFFGNILNYPIRRGLVLMNGAVIGTQGSSTGASANVWNGFINIAGVDQTMVGVTGVASSAGNSKLFVHNTTSELPVDNAFSGLSTATDRYSTSFGNLLTTLAGNITACLPILTAGYRVGLSQPINTVQRNAVYSTYLTSILTTSSSTTPQAKWLLKQQMHKAIRQSAIGSDTTVASFYATQQNMPATTYYEVDSLLSIGDVASAQTKNNLAVVTNALEQNHKDFNTVYVNGAVSSNDYATLQTLANLCAYENGNAVYQARALLDMISYAHTEYNNTCGFGKDDGEDGDDDKRLAHHDEGVSVVANINAKLYPNPNNGEYTLAYDLKQTPEATVNITDITGKLVYTTQISNESNLIKINTQELQSGLYFIQLHANGKLVWTDKVMINK